jgi:hypothetical protein
MAVSSIRSLIMDFMRLLIGIFGVRENDVVVMEFSSPTYQGRTEAPNNFARLNRFKDRCRVLRYAGIFMYIKSNPSMNFFLNYNNIIITFDTSSYAAVPHHTLRYLINSIIFTSFD